MARITKADREELIQESTPVKRLKEIYTMYVEKRRYGIYKGRRARQFMLFSEKIVNYLVSEHVQFCREFSEVEKKNPDMQMDAVIDRLMEKKLAVAYGEVYRGIGKKWEACLNPKADDFQLLELMDEYLGKFFRDNRRFVEEMKKNEMFRYELEAGLVEQQQKILAVLEEDMNAQGWDYANKSERLERFFYRLDKLVYESFFKERDIEDIWDPDTERNRRRALIGKYVDIKKDEPHDFHRMQLIAFMNEGIINRMEQAVKECCQEVKTTSGREKREARNRLEDIFETAYQEEYAVYGDRLYRFLVEGGEGNFERDEDKILFRFIMKNMALEDVKKGNMRVDETGKLTSDGPSYKELLTEQQEYRREKISYVYDRLAGKARYFANTEKFQEKMLQYGYDPEKQSEWLERMLYRLSLDKKDAELDFKIQRDNEKAGYDVAKNGEKIQVTLVDGVQAGTVGISKKKKSEGKKVTKLSGGGAVSALWTETEERLFEYSAMLHARDLIKRMLNNTKPKSYTTLSTIYYLWLYPYLDGKEMQEIVESYGTKRNSYPERLEYTYGSETMAIMRNDLREDLNVLMDDEIFQKRRLKRLQLEEYSGLDKKMELLAKKDHLNVSEKATESGEFAMFNRLYELEDQNENKVAIREEAEYHRLYQEKLKDRIDISKKISTQKRSIKWEKEVEIMMDYIKKLRKEGM